MKVKHILALVAALVLAAALAPAQAETPKVVTSLNDFPSAGLYEIHSKPSFLISVGQSQEVVECEATLIVRAADSYLTDQGSRRVELTVVDWKATGNSALLGGALNFRMQQGVKTEDASFVESYQANAFPAQAQFAVPYELDTPFGKVSGLYGVTRGSIKSFPPRGDVFMMEKGDVADLMAKLMPAPLSELSAAGDTGTSTVAIQPLACLCPAPVDEIN